MTRSPLLARWLFGVRVPPLEPGNRYFDLTTLAFKRAVRRRVAADSRVLDMGTGCFAILGLWMRRTLGCEVVCSEVDSRAAERARENVKRNGVAIEVICTSLFDGLEGDFDLVCFNPPYLRTGTGVERDQPEELRTMWDGGPDGADTIRAFLDAFSGRETRATALLGVNRLHVPRERVVELVRARPGVELAEIDSRPLLPVDLYALVRTKSPRTRTSMPLA